jgi:hypothetical protein
MVYLRTIHDLTLFTKEHLPAGAHSYSELDRIPITVRYSADIIFEIKSGEVVYHKNRHNEVKVAKPVTPDIVWILLQSKFQR